MTAAAIELKKLDPSALGTALKQLGEAVPIVAQAGQLIRQGLEKLKRAIEALMEMFGKDALKKLKEQIEQLAKAAGLSLRGLLQSVLGADSVKQRIGDFDAALSSAKVDTASNALPELARSFNRDNKMLRALLRAIQLSGVVLGLLQLAASWLVPVLAVAYVSVIGVAVLIGRQYTGAGRVLTWSDGVQQVAERIP